MVMYGSTRGHSPHRSPRRGKHAGTQAQERPRWRSPPAVVLAACGDDDDSTEATTGATSASTAPAGERRKRRAATRRHHRPGRVGRRADRSAHVAADGDDRHRAAAGGARAEVGGVRQLRGAGVPGQRALPRRTRSTRSAGSSTMITYDAAAPGSAFQQAIDSGVDYIATSGVAARGDRGAGRPGRGAGHPDLRGVLHRRARRRGEQPLLADRRLGERPVVASDVLADWVIDDSGGDANVALRDDPRLPDPRGRGGGGPRPPSPSGARDCSVEALPATIDDLGAGDGSAAGRVVPAVEPRRRLRLVLLLQPLDRRVRRARRRRAARGPQARRHCRPRCRSCRRSSTAPTAAWTAMPLRVRRCGSSPTRWPATPPACGAPSWRPRRRSCPTWVVDSPEAAEELVPDRRAGTGPDGFEDSFKALWGVAG